MIFFSDVLGSTAFMPVKSDINGNIQRLQTQYDTAPDQFPTLQSIVDSEISAGTNKGSKSCTVGLLWLKRALEFICVFLESAVGGEEDLVKCANKAYDESLRKYHGWIVKGIFSVAVRAVPYHKDFVTALKKDASVSSETLYSDMQAALTPLRETINELNRFYTLRGQHSDDTV
ncbi:Glycolipid transfer protein [Geodia barretti]|uniref:Glycolipid transfer protein n=1 Tax=Geodia barretti TaxID=519541 RepID=A0AA35SDP2_GEOBA|nr:Glycolipid transfer protein [Geodia barretti]